MTGPIAKHEDIKYTEYELIRVFNHTYESTVSGRHYFLNHWHEELELTYNFEGGTVFIIDGEQIQGEAGRLIAINPESIHSIVPDMNMSRKGVLGVTILLHPKFMEQNFPRYKEFYFTNEKPQISAEMREIIRKISAYASREEVGRNVYPLYVKGLILQLLFHMEEEGMLRQMEDADIKRVKGTGYLKEILSYVGQNYRGPLSQKEVAERFHFTQQYFSRYFKKYTGQTFTEYVMRYRVQQARKELLESDKRIVDIALENGFSEERRFIAAFKRFYQETPLQYRKKYAHLRF